MSLLDQFKHGVDLTRWKADQAMRIRQVQGEIETLRREITVVRDQIASQTLNLHRQGTITNPELEELCVKIDQIFEQIGSKENEIELIRVEEPPSIPAPAYRPSNPCPNCNFDVPLSAKFCTNCGYTMPERPAPIQPATASSGRFCTNCGSALEVGAVFCTECGHKNPIDSKPSEEEES